MPESVVGEDGVTAIESSGGPGGVVTVTVKVIVALTPRSVTVMVVLPLPVLVASPFCPSALLIVATLGLGRSLAPGPAIGLTAS